MELLAYLTGTAIIVIVIYTLCRKPTNKNELEDK